MNRSNDAIREFTKNQLRGNLWQGILATIVPGIIAAFINWIIGEIVNQSYFITMITSTILAVFTTFMVAKMALNLANGEKEAGFEESLSPSDSFISVLIYVVAFQAFAYFVQLPLNYLFFDSWIVTGEGITNLLNTSMSSTELMALLYGYILSALLLGLLLLFLTYKFIYVPYIIIDQHVGVKEAVSKSFQYTKGNFMRIIGMSFFFIGWYLLSVFTCGILLFYVIPYETVSRMNLYLEIKYENGDGQREREIPEVHTVYDPLKQESKNDDPFKEYYQ